MTKVLKKSFSDGGANAPPCPPLATPLIEVRHNIYHTKENFKEFNLDEKIPKTGYLVELYTGQLVL